MVRSLNRTCVMVARKAGRYGLYEVVRSVTSTYEHAFINMVNVSGIVSKLIRAGTRNIVDAIKGKMVFSLPDHNVLISEAMANMHTTLQHQDEVILHSTLANSELNAKTRRAIQRAVEGKVSSWLTALPIAHHHLTFLPQNSAMPSHCDTIDHC